MTKDQAAALALLKAMTDSERRDVFTEFCVHCGSTDTHCQCWNDE